MNKLLKSIPDMNMDIITKKANITGISSSAYIRELIRKDIGITDIHIKDVPTGVVVRLRTNVSHSGLSLDDYIIKLIMEAGPCLK